MKIMKVIDKKIGDTTYIKYRINLPKEIVEKSGFLNNELRVEFKKRNIVIHKEE